jgi:PIN domain nuclease of toxin-antitoxin system
MKPVVLDSSALIAFCDPDDPCHPGASHCVTQALQVGRPLVVPVSVLSEVLVGAYRSTPHAVRTVDKLVDELVSEIQLIDREVARAAARYRAAQAGLPLGVALVLGTARVVGAQQVLTTDSSWPDVGLPVHVLRPPTPAAHDHIT